MLLLEKVTGKSHRKIIVVCDQAEKKKLEGQSVLAESIRQFGVEVMLIEIDSEMQQQIFSGTRTSKNDQCVIQLVIYFDI